MGASRVFPDEEGAILDYTSRFNISPVKFLRENPVGELFGKLRVVSVLGKREGCGTIVSVKCLSCSDNYFCCQIKSIRSGNTKSCGCERQDPLKVISQLEDMSWGVISRSKKVNNPWSVICPRGHLQNKYPRNILTGSKCIQCSGKINTYSHDNILKELSRHIPDCTFRGWHTEFTGVTSSVSLQCTSCNSVFTRRVNNILYKGANCSCRYSNNRFDYLGEAYLYIHKVTGGDIDFYKVGITNKEPSIRINQQIRKTRFSSELITCLLYETGEEAAKAEKLIKNRFSLGVVPKEEFPDGFTETFLAEELDNIHDFIFKTKSFLRRLK